MMAQIFKYLVDTSNSDTPDMAVDGTTPKHYDYTASKKTYIHRVNIQIIDGSISPLDFGGIASVITNVILFRHYDHSDSLVTDFTDGYPIKTNGQFVYMAGTDVDRDTTAGDDVLSIRWTIAKSGSPLVLYKNQYFRVTVQDNIAAITSMRMMVQGTT
jgi:hypothetical protein